MRNRGLVVYLALRMEIQCRTKEEPETWLTKEMYISCGVVVQREQEIQDSWTLICLGLRWESVQVVLELTRWSSIELGCREQAKRKDRLDQEGREVRRIWGHKQYRIHIPWNCLVKFFGVIDDVEIVWGTDWWQRQNHKQHESIQERNDTHPCLSTGQNSRNPEGTQQTTHHVLSVGPGVVWCL